jgi:hypothetical protein
MPLELYLGLAFGVPLSVLLAGLGVEWVAKGFKT